MTPLRGVTRLRRAVETGVGMVTGGIGAALLALAVPIAGGGLAGAPGNAILKRLSGETPGAPALRRLIRSREASLDWRETGRTAAELALARMMLAERGGAGVHGARETALAEAALVKGLGLAPMNPYGWVRLARVRTAQRRPAAEVAPVLGLAIHTGPREARLRRHVVEAGLYAWSALDRTGRGAVAARVREAWAADAQRTSALAAGVGRTGLLARIVLHPGDGER